MQCFGSRLDPILNQSQGMADSESESEWRPRDYPLLYAHAAPEFCTIHNCWGYKVSLGADKNKHLVFKWMSFEEFRNLKCNNNEKKKRKRDDKSENGKPADMPLLPEDPSRKNT